jgi:uncharacterized membrane protein YkvI
VVTGEPGQFSWLAVLKIAGAFTAYLIGSGFATGQEAMQFFVAYGALGVLGAALSLILFIYVCGSLMLAGKHYGLTRNEDVFRFYCGDYIGVFLTWYTMIFIVAVHAIMLAGAGATLEQAYGLPAFAGSCLMALLSMVTLLLGLEKILDALGVLGPLIVVLTISIAVLSLVNAEGALAQHSQQALELDLLKASPHWLFSSLLYVGMTLPGLASFLPAVGATTHNDREIKVSSVIGPAFFIGAMVLVVLALMYRIGDVHDAQVPIMVLASQVMPVYGSIFAVIIFMGIFTTVTPLLWTVCARFASEGTARYRSLVVGLTLVGLFGGTLLPFGKLINIIYPTVGYAGLLFLVCAIFRDIRRARRH